jgi:hypothetical protein
MAATTKEYYADVTPSMSKLLTLVVPSLGHDTSAALKDLLDNSYDAEADAVEVCILQDNDTKEINGYHISDNGHGMDDKTLIESSRFATDISHVAGDAGKFGVGGTIASFTLANRKVTLTRAKGSQEIICAEMNIKWFSDPKFDGNQACLVRNPTKDEIRLFKENVGAHGTCILLTDLKEPEYKAAHFLAKKLEKEFAVAFHRRLTSNKKIAIKYNDKTVEVVSRDPLYFDQPEKLLSSYNETIDFKGGKIQMRFSILNLDLFRPPLKSYDMQGIYVTRNDRMIMEGASLGIWPNHPTRNAGRVEICFSEELDDDFGLTATKNRVILSNDLKNKIKPLVDKFKALVTSHALQRKPGKDISDQIAKEDRSFSDMLKTNGASLQLPSSSLPGTEKIERSGHPAGKKKGSVKSKGTGIKRRAKKVVAPEFEYVQAPRVKEHVWYEFNEDLTMKIKINTSHPYVRDMYIKGTQETKRSLRVWWAAECMVRYDYYGSDEEPTVESYSNLVAEKLSKVYSVVK